MRIDLTAKGPFETLRMTIDQRLGQLPLIHHSDRGIEYCCDDYINLLTENKIDISMTENSDPYENALAERMNRTLKEEFLQYYHYFNYEQANEAVARAIRLYNVRRPHLSLKYKTPNMVYEADATKRHLPLPSPQGVTIQVLQTIKRKKLEFFCQLLSIFSHG